MLVIRLEPGIGWADSHPGRVAQVLCEALGMLLGSWVVTDQPNPKGGWFSLCPQPPSPNLLNQIELSFLHHLFWALE